MISVRESLAAQGQAVRIRRLAWLRQESFPLSLRRFVSARQRDPDDTRDHRTSPIQHVFVLMLENRSFDHMLGFSGITGTDTATGLPATIEGLTGTESNTFRERKFTVTTGAADVMGIGPRHEFIDVLEQLCGSDAAARYRKGDAYPDVDGSGYVSSYAKQPGVGPDSAGNVMKCFSPNQLPVLNALAREFMVCDHWFSSMPGPTNPNRMFMHAATSGAFDDSPKDWEIAEAVGLPGGGFKFRHGTVFKLLDRLGVKYRIYADDPFPVAAQLDGVSVVRDIREFEDLAADLRDPSFDAGFVHIEPSYDALDNYEDSNCQHPSGSVRAGERLIKATYEAIRSSPVWAKSLLIITWDEHGGFYDHVIPASAAGTGERGGRYGFTFEQLGPRVPAVVVSPLIARNLIEKRPFDHTAIAATLRRVFKLPSLGARDGLSGGLDQLAGSTARTDAPLKLPDIGAAGVALLASRRPSSKTAPRRPAALLSDDPGGGVATLIHSALAQHLQVTPAEEHPAIIARVQLLTTHAGAFAYLKEVEQLVHAKRVEARLVPA